MMWEYHGTSDIYGREICQMEPVVRPIGELAQNSSMEIGHVIYNKELIYHKKESIKT